MTVYIEYVELSHRGPDTSDGEVAVLRLLVRLPRHWRCRHAATADRIRIWITVPGDATPERVRAAVAESLNDPALAAWRLEEAG
ncbi:hypothetical protein [Streptomyces sp. TRM49041]|uniref:hypothetical protein n=1 Tax=Streptomyces sp. TRM49041 TaxID=2603216 RepID=UPI0011EFA229|nr:hypothetical protein [Streptomyces sp. TRM49041]